MADSRVTAEERRRRRLEYGPEHREARDRALARAQPMDKCPRCRLPLGPKIYTEPTAFEYDHRDDRDGYLGLSHQLCNRKAGGRKGAEIRFGDGYRPVIDW